MPQLENLDVDRVDAVDRPANETPFLIAKSVGDLPAFQSDDLDDVVANAQQLAEKAQFLIGSLGHQRWTPKSVEAATAANELAKLVGFDGLTFTAKSAFEADGEPGDVDGDPEDVQQGSNSNVERALNQLAKLQSQMVRGLQHFEAIVVKSIESSAQAPRSRNAARSNQIADEPEPVEKGDTPEFGKGMFADIVCQPVFGRGA